MELIAPHLFALPSCCSNLDAQMLCTHSLDDLKLLVLDLILVFWLCLQELLLDVKGSETNFLSLLDFDPLKLFCNTLNHVFLQGSNHILVLC